MDIFRILDPDPHENLCRSETLAQAIWALKVKIASIDWQCLFVATYWNFASLFCGWPKIGEVLHFGCSVGDGDSVHIRQDHLYLYLGEILHWHLLYPVPTWDEIFKMHQDTESETKFCNYLSLKSLYALAVLWIQIRIGSVLYPYRYWIRIQERPGSGSVFGIRIRIHAWKYKLKWGQKM